MDDDYLLSVCWTDGCLCIIIYFVCIIKNVNANMYLFRNLMLRGGYNFNKLESNHNIFNWLELYLSFRPTLEILIVINHTWCDEIHTHKIFIMFVWLIMMQYQIIFFNLPTKIKEYNIIW